MKNSDKTDNLQHLNLENLKVSSSTDCTGLIPAVPGTEAEREAYEELYDIGADEEKNNT